MSPTAYSLRAPPRCPLLLLLHTLCYCLLLAQLSLLPLLSSSARQTPVLFLSLTCISAYEGMLTTEYCDVCSTRLGCFAIRSPHAVPRYNKIHDSPQVTAKTGIRVRVHLRLSQLWRIMQCSRHTNHPYQQPGPFGLLQCKSCCNQTRTAVAASVSCPLHSPLGATIGWEARKSLRMSAGWKQLGFRLKGDNPGCV